MSWQEPCGFQPIRCREPRGIFWKATAFSKLNILIPPPQMARRLAVFQRQACMFTSMTFMLWTENTWNCRQFPRKQRWRISLLRLNFLVPSRSPFPAFAGLPRSARSLEIWAHDLTTNLLGDFVRLGTVGQGVHLVCTMSATTQPRAWWEPLG